MRSFVVLCAVALFAADARAEELIGFFVASRGRVSG